MIRRAAPGAAAACSFAIGLVVGLSAPPAVATSVILADQGRAKLEVALAASASPAERTAAEELVTYLERVTAADFALVSESDLGPERPAIWVGPTATARRMGYHAENLGSEEWRIRSADGQLVLVGGRPRGTLYAVYRFLEDFVGVRWWTPFEDHVPRRPDLEVDAAAAGQPAFVSRDFVGVEGPPLFHARNRSNGNFSSLTEAQGGREVYGPPFFVHTFFEYVPPAEYFAGHPEFYSERNGRRVAKQAQLCLTNDELPEVVTTRLRTFIDRAATEAAARGEDPPRLFDFSQNDWRRPCECRNCRELERREGSRSGSLVHFVNQVAQAIAGEHPELLLSTLAYEHTFRPPRRARLRDNVVLRLADLYQRDFAKPVTHPANREVRRALQGWLERTAHLRVWNYAVTFGRQGHNLPLASLAVIAEDFRFYRDRGVEGLFIQLDDPILSDLRDLKLWVVFKLAEDPARDLDALVAEFCSGFFGAAGATMREYLALLEQAAADRAVSIRFPTDHGQYRHLTPSLLRRTQALFDRAERQAGDDAVLLRRLRFARLSLDRATLWRWNDRLARPTSGSSPGAPIDPVLVAQRLQATALEQIEIRLRQGARERQRALVRREVETVLARISRRAAPARRLPSPQEALHSPESP